MRLFSPDGAGGGPAVAELAPHIPEEFRGERSLEAIKDIPTLVKSYVNAQKLIGQDRVTLPQQSWGKNEWDQYYTKLGRPTRPDDYELPTDVKLDESIQLDDGKLKTVRQAFYDMGLSKKQAEGVLRYYFGSLNEQVTQGRTTLEQATAALKEQWRENFDANVQGARDVLKKIGDEELLTYVEESGIGNHPAFIRMMHKISLAMGEDVSARGGRGADARSRDSALAEIEVMKSDADMIRLFRNDETLPPLRKKELLDRWNSLHAIAYPGTQTT